MVRVQDFCIDRWEILTVDHESSQPLSPYYPPHRVLLRRVWELWQNERSLVGDEAARLMPLPDLPLWQRTHDFEPRAVSRAGVVPQAYMNYHQAKLACENAGKRLCKKEEWVQACKGQRQTKFPYGDQYAQGKCNVWRTYHPAHILHGSSAIGHGDPRLNLVIETGTKPLLLTTGASQACVSRWGEDGVYDMVGNLDEWIDDEAGVFLGGFYARSTTKGCDAEIRSHAPVYYDYSTGVRCCKSISR
jgi:hypothetical protein